MRTETNQPTAAPGKTAICPTCGVKREDWVSYKGYPKDGETYCCVGCATSLDCTCI
jgi:hypothetical protein